jgi:LPXTG-site transpeptidase (sortase) family protein
MVKNFLAKYKNEVKLFIVLYVLALLLFNWSDVSWIFNYKEISGLAADFFNPYPGIDALSMKLYLPENQNKIEIKNNYVYTEKISNLEIPKISIAVPIIFSQSANLSLLKKDLDEGVVYYPGSVLPGEKGDIVILGHSAPAGWPKIKYDWVFSDIDKLVEGDNIMVDLNNRQYTFIVRKTTIIKRGQSVPKDLSSAENNVLTLVSCWPPGKDYQRIAVQAVLVD